MTTARFQVCSIGRSHYVQHVISRELLGVAFSSRRKAQAAVDERNARNYTAPVVSRREGG